MRIAIIIILWAISSGASAQDGSESKLKAYGDFRGRVEFDRDSRKTDGTYRDDRDRMRIRFRLGIDYRYDQHVSLGGPSQAVSAR